MKSSIKSLLVLMSYFRHNRHIIDCIVASMSLTFLIPAAEVLCLSFKTLEYPVSSPFVPLYQVFRCSSKQRMSPYKQLWFYKYLDIQEWTCLELLCNGEAGGIPGKKENTSQFRQSTPAPVSDYPGATNRCPLDPALTWVIQHVKTGSLAALRDLKCWYLAQAE